MKFKSVRRAGGPSPERLAQLESLSAQLEAEVPEVATTGRSVPFHQALAVRAIMHALREVRIGLGLSLDDMAARTGMDKSYLSRLETFRQENVTLVTVERVARALRKRVEFVIVDEGSESPGVAETTPGRSQ